MKTLKTYIALLLLMAIATGRPLFDRFEVEQAGPVLVYVGEGGRIPYTRRLVRVAEAIGVDPKSAELYPTFDVAPVDSPRFRRSLERDIADIEPALIVIDPLYAYHGTSTNAANLHEEGALLTNLSAPCAESGTALMVVNHFNQTGTGRGLKRITQAGSGE